MDRIRQIYSFSKLYLYFMCALLIMLNYDLFYFIIIFLIYILTSLVFLVILNSEGYGEVYLV